MHSRQLAPIAALSGLILLAGLMPAYAAPTKTPTITSKPAGAPGGPAKKTALTQLPVPAVERTNAPRIQTGGRPAASQTAALPARQTEKFTMLGVTWAPGTKTAPRIEVRLLQRDAWSEWRELSVDPDSQSEDPKARPGTAPTFVGDSRGVEVRALVEDGAASPQDLKVALIDPQQLASDADPETVRPPASPRAQAPIPPGIITRAGWRADESLHGSCDTPYNRTVRAATVHHTEGSNNYTREQSPGIVRGIYAYHVQGNGWCDIGYNFLVDKYGQIFEGRRGGITQPVKGAHAYNWNTDTMGVSLMGNFMSTMPTEVQLDAAVRLIAWRLAAYYRNPWARITINGITSEVINGHRDVYNTDCPGDRLYAYLPTFRQRVANAMGSFETPIKARWEQLGGPRGPAGEPRVGEAPVANGRVTQFEHYDIFSAPGVRTSFTKGIIRDRYRQLGTANSFLGFPDSDEVCDGRTGCFNLFRGGVILWSPATGARFNRGAIRERYGTVGYEHGFLGYPTTDELCSNNSCHQDFTGGIIVWSPSTGPQVVKGSILDSYRSAGGRTGFLGSPRGDERCDNTGCRQEFVGGMIWYSYPTASHWTRGTIQAKYVSLGGPRSSLGYPTTDEICSDVNNCQQRFTGGRILWNRDRGAWLG